MGSKGIGTKNLNSSGFTLIELLVTIIVLSIIITSLGGMYYITQIAQTKTTYYDMAVRNARSEIENLRNNGYSSLTNDSTFSFNPSPGLPPNATGSVAVCSSASPYPSSSEECPPGLKRVDVTIEYTTYGSTQTVTLSSDIGIIGLTQ